MYSQDSADSETLIIHWVGVLGLLGTNRVVDQGVSFCDKDTQRFESGGFIVRNDSDGFNKLTISTLERTSADRSAIVGLLLTAIYALMVSGVGTERTPSGIVAIVQAFYEFCE